MLASIRLSLWRLINLFRRHRSDSSLNRELAFHLDMEIEENLRQGMNPDEARRRAHIALGGLEQTREEYRNTRGIRWLDELWQDLRYAQRVLTRSPGFTIVAISVLALGIGANTAVVSIIDTVVFRPLPVWRPDQLANIVGPVSYPDYLEIKSDDQIFSGVVTYGLPLELENDQHPEGFSGQCVSANFYQVLGLRMAVGRARVVRQLLTEGMVLSLLALVASLAVWGLTLRCLSVINIEGSLSAEAYYFLPHDLEIGIDHRVLIIAFCITFLTNLIFALAPALVGSRPELTSSLKNQGFLFVGRAGSRWRRIPVVIQIALSSILLVGSGLFTRTIVRFQSVDPGFDQKVMILKVGKPFHGFDVARSISHYRQVLERIQAVPGVVSASFAADIPPERGAVGMRMRADDSFGGDDKWHWFDCNAVTPGYFKTLRMPIIQGRDFTDRDNETSADVVIVNETLARRYWPGVNALGKRMRVQGFEGEKDRSCEIVGVVGDAKYSAVWQGAKPYLYFPLFQFYLHDPKLQISVFGNPSSVIGSIRKVLEPLGPDVRVDQVRLISAEMDSMLDRERSTAYVFGIFGAIALILAGVGLYGVISYFVAQRTREFGIRMALGAQPADIIRQIIREGMVLVVVGLAIGLPCSMALSRFVSSQLHGVSTADPLTYITISILCLAATLLAVLLPARRATANPMEALRFE